jgi:hypothetical protein
LRDSEHDELVFPGGRSRLSRQWLYVLALAIAFAAALAILNYGRIQFAGEDGGITADVAYMGKLGYIPYDEIRATGFPPIFILPAGWAFTILGVRWTSLMALAAAFSAVALVAQVWLSERVGFGRVTALLLALCTQAATMLPVSFWWYNQVTSVLGVLYVTAVFGLIKAPKDRMARVALVATAVALSWGKPNVAGPLLLGTGVALLMYRETRRTGPALLGLAALVSLALLIVFRADPRLIVGSYLSASARMNISNIADMFWRNDNPEAARTLALLAVSMLAAFASLVRMRGSLPWTGARPAATAVAFVGISTGLIAMGTNNDHNLVDAPIVLVGCVAIALLARWETPASRVAVACMLTAAVLGATVTGLVSTVVRSRILSAGMGLYYEEPPLEPVGGPPMMNNVLVGLGFRTVVAQIDELMTLNPALRRVDAPVFFGPRLLVMYPEWGIAPPRRTPTWWSPPKDGSPLLEADIQRLRDYRYALMIFLTEDHSFYPDGLKRMLSEDFDMYRWGVLSIRVRKGATDVILPRDAVLAR